ncbi:Hypothetical protein CAP_0011 [Chondromyces apiculatus DSM 436]|uniref:Uncharacterized protein n=1 Tax=Chondromyces apiculatus DSM 436 TaxID=1192034 RepID=A0A017TJ59_9BACT|nr:Hypothetical protein CAP_0011 [Chondromyces apiculatus DSM 436]
MAGTLEQLVTLKGEARVSDANLARALLALRDGRALHAALAGVAGARDTLLRVVWLFYVAAARITPRSLALVPASVDLLEAGECTLEELLSQAIVALLPGSDDDAAELADIEARSGDDLAAAVDVTLAALRGGALESHVNVIARQVVSELVDAMPLFREQLGEGALLALSSPRAVALDLADMASLDMDLLEFNDGHDGEDGEEDGGGFEDEYDDDDDDALDDDGLGSFELTDEAVLLLLPPETRCVDIRHAAAEVRLWWKELRAATPEHDVHVEWSTADDRTTITTAYDSGLDVIYMIVQGEDRMPLAARMASLLGGETEAEVLARLGATRDRETWMLGLSRVALIAELRPNAPVGEALRAALEHAEPEVRHTALLFAPPDAIDGLEEAVQGIALVDPSRRVRAAAARCLGQTAFTPRPPHNFAVTARLTAVHPISRREVMRLAWEAGLWLDEVQPACKGRALTLTWLTSDGQSVFHYLEDEIRKAQLFVIRGDEEGDLTRKLQEAFALVPTASLGQDESESVPSGALRLALPGSLTIHDVSRRLAHLGWIWSSAERDEEDEYASITWKNRQGCLATLRLGITPALWLEGPDEVAAAAQLRSALPVRDARQLLDVDHLALELDAAARQQALLEVAAVAGMMAS